MMSAKLEATNHLFGPFLADTTGRKSKMEYIIVRKEWTNSVNNTEAYNSYSSIGSDHSLLRL